MQISTKERLHFSSNSRIKIASKTKTFFLFSVASNLSVKVVCDMKSENNNAYLQPISF